MTSIKDLIYKPRHQAQVGLKKDVAIDDLIMASNSFIMRLFEYAQRIRILFYMACIITICLFVLKITAIGYTGILFLIAHYIYLNKLKKELRLELAVKKLLSEMKIAELTGEYPDFLK